jgi:hypothetical protein
MHFWTLPRPLASAGLPQDEANQLALLREPLGGLRHRLKLLKTPEGQASAPAWEVFAELPMAVEAFLERLPIT